MKQTLYEWCPFCGAEIHVLWDIQAQGFLTTCPSCGHALLLCGECKANCDYDHHTDLCQHIVEAMWKELSDVPFELPENQDEHIADSLTLYGISFPAGTTKTEIWHWFDANHPKGVAYLLYEFH